MKISKNKVKCVVPENIHTPTEGKGKFRGGGGPKGGNFRGGGEGLLFGVFFPGASSEIGELLRTKSCSVKQTNRCYFYFYLFIYFFYC